ncbi:hypothetical protein HAX54_035061 [Datura stramonium]|uniref:Putative plant transposon protein domain-containing protein n=1 Tax=Datura stramonium TaxID=4076 RepID=A0ABS8VI08_DATST|nr:hypothetical protein [Datura stramonium]
MWLDLVCSRLMPSRNTSEVPIEVVILLACIMKHVHINVGEIIADQFRRKAKQQATTFHFLPWAKMHENQLVRLAKAIPSMIQNALKKALQPAKDRLTHLCLKVDVLESEVMTLQREVDLGQNSMPE